MLSPAYASRSSLTPREAEQISNLSANAATRFRGAVLAYQKLGPVEFLNQFPLSATERAYLQNRYFRGIPKLPSVEARGDTLTLRDAYYGQQMQIRILSLDDRKVQVNGKELSFGADADISEIAEVLESIAGGTPNASFFRFRLIPEAHASVGAALGFMLLGMGGAMLVKGIFSWWKKDKDKKSDSTSEGGAADAHASLSAGGVGGSGGGGSGTPEALATQNQPGTVANVSADTAETVDKAIAADPNLPAYNKMVLEQVKKIGNGCTYNKGVANANVENALVNFPKSVDYSKMSGTHCSGYSYTVFAGVVAQAVPNLSPQAAEAMKRLDRNQQNVPTVDDGKKPFGYFNAQAFGTAELFTEKKLGENFTDIAKAKPGDFLKIIWSTSKEPGKIGSVEEGHSVIYLGSSATEICFASANQSGNKSGQPGCGVRCEPKTKVRDMMFSRLTAPQNANSFTPDMKSDYLKEAQTQSKDLAEAVKRVTPQQKI